MAKFIPIGFAFVLFAVALAIVLVSGWGLRIWYFVHRVHREEALEDAERSNKADAQQPPDSH